MLLAERADRSFLSRTGPWFVRALAGLAPVPALRGQEIWPRTRRGGHGPIVVGSHVSQTIRQVAALGARRATVDIELDVASVITSPDQVVADTARQVAAALSRSDVLLYTSRTMVRGRDAADGLATARMVFAAQSQTVRHALAAEPAWVIAKGGDHVPRRRPARPCVRRAEVAGQLFPGVISLFRPIDAAPPAIGMPYVVFAGDDQALAQVAAILNGEQQDP